jgi:hypothetical protein
MAPAETVDERADRAGGGRIAPAAAVVGFAVRDGERGARIDGVSEHLGLACRLRGVGEALDAPLHAGGRHRALERRIAVLDDERIETGDAPSPQHFGGGAVVIAVVAPAEQLHRA